MQELPDWEAKLLRAAEVFDDAHRRSAVSWRAAGDRLTDSYALVAASLRQAAALLHERALQVNMLHNPARVDQHGAGLVFLIRCSVCRRLVRPQKGKLVPSAHFWMRKRCLGGKIAVETTEAYHVSADNALTPCRGYYEGCSICRGEKSAENNQRG